jgi:hypothetical protein
MIEAFVMVAWALIPIAVAFWLLWDELKESKK